jgi:hypothetical protein
MKTHNNFLIRSILTLLTVVCLASMVSAQELDKGKAKELVESKNFVFKAQSVQPMGGPSRQLTSDYDLKLLGDSIVSYLPYFGRAYTAPDPGDPGGINFTSTAFEYKAKPKKKGGWNIDIKPTDTKDVRHLTLSVGETGYAQLQVTSNSRQNISYYGYIMERK